MKVPEYFARDRVDRIHAVWLGIIRDVAAFSVALRANEMLSRVGRMNSRQLWNLDGGVELNWGRARHFLLRRGVEQERIDCIYVDWRRARESAKNADPEDLRWIAHGHVAWDLLWASMATLLHVAGCPNPTCEQVESGHFDDKIRFFSDHWAVRALNAEASSPDSLWEWLGRAA